MIAMKISLVMCTRNRSAILLRFSISLSNQLRQVDEYIIIDSSDISIDNTDDFVKIKLLFPNLIYKHTSPGLTYQRNQGVTMVTGDVVFFFDDDIVLEKEYIKNIISIFERNSQYAGGMGQIPVNPTSYKGKIKNEINKFFMLPNKKSDGKFYASGFAKMPHGGQKFLEVEVLSGGIAAYKTDILRKYKFDEYFSGYGFMEDAEYSRRISKKHKLFYNPQAICYHQHASGGRGDSYQLGMMVMKNYIYINKKHFSSKIAFCWSVIGMFLTTLFFERNMKKIKGYFHGIIK
jgi:GT2 family glycosyltransferase